MQLISLSNATAFSHVGDVIALERKTFLDGEINLSLCHVDFSSSSFLLIQSLFGGFDSFLELSLAIDVIRRNSSKPIHLLLPYLSYMRQEREISQYAPISAKVIASLISSQEIQTVSIADLHVPHIQSYFSVPCFNISIMSFILDHIRRSYTTNNFVIVAADIGGAKFARQVANLLNVQSAIIEKERAEPGVSRAMSLTGDVQNKICIIIDDIIDSAGTLCNASNLLQSHGATEIIAYATHGIFSGNALEKIQNSSITKIFVTNTLPQKQLSKIQYLDISSYIIEQTKEKIKFF